MSLFEQAQQLQRQYWTHDPEEQAVLQQKWEKDAAALSPAQLLRLHHLHCLELVHSALEQEFPLSSTRPQPEHLAPKQQQVLDALLARHSPYAAGVYALWLHQGQGQQPDFVGGILNSSLAHLNALEVFRLDDNGVPIALDFVPLSQLQAIHMEGTAPYRPAQLHYANQPPQQVLFSGVYGLSAHSTNATDLDGSGARALRSFVVPALGGANLHLALGQQIYLLNDGQKMRLMPSLHVGRLGTP